MTAPDIMYTDITQAAKDWSTSNWSAIVGMAGDKDVCKNKIKRVVPVIITADFQAVKEISSDFVVSNDVDIRGKFYRMDINLVY